MLYPTKNTLIVFGNSPLSFRFPRPLRVVSGSTMGENMFHRKDPGIGSFVGPERADQMLQLAK